MVEKNMDLDICEHSQTKWKDYYTKGVVIDELLIFLICVHRLICCALSLAIRVYRKIQYLEC